MYLAMSKPLKLKKPQNGAKQRANEIEKWEHLCVGRKMGKRLQIMKYVYFNTFEEGWEKRTLFIYSGKKKQSAHFCSIQLHKLLLLHFCKTGARAERKSQRQNERQKERRSQSKATKQCYICTKHTYTVLHKRHIKCTQNAIREQKGKKHTKCQNQWIIISHRGVMCLAYFLCSFFSFNSRCFSPLPSTSSTLDMSRYAIKEHKCVGSFKRAIIPQTLTQPAYAKIAKVQMSF